MWTGVSVLGNVSQTVIGRWQHKLSKLLEIESAIAWGIILADDVGDLLRLKSHVMFAQKLNDVNKVDLSLLIGVKEREGFIWDEVW